MTQTQETELQNALDRLAKKGLKATAVKLDTMTIYLVPSQSEKINHVVYQNADGKFVCDCYYGRNAGKVCIHKAAAYVAATAEPDYETMMLKACDVAHAQGWSFEYIVDCFGNYGKPKTDDRAAMPVAQGVQSAHIFR